MGGSTKLMSSGAGGVILTTPGSIAADVTVNLPTQNSTLAINGPAFSAYMSANQTVTGGTWTKVQYNTEEYDTNSNYDTSTYRFTPTVAGYYQVTAANAVSATQTYNILAIYKNGTIAKQGIVNSAAGAYQFVVTALIYCNGTTDYLEIYGQTSGAAPTFQLGQTTSYFQAALVRSA